LIFMLQQLEFELPDLAGLPNTYRQKILVYKIWHLTDHSHMLNSVCQPYQLPNSFKWQH